MNSRAPSGVDLNNVGVSISVKPCRFSCVRSTVDGVSALAYYNHYHGLSDIVERYWQLWIVIEYFVVAQVDEDLGTCIVI